MEAVERLCDKFLGHNLVTNGGSVEDPQLRPAVNSWGSTGIGESGGVRTHDPRLKNWNSPSDANLSESDNFPGLKELSEFWPL